MCNQHLYSSTDPTAKSPCTPHVTCPNAASPFFSLFLFWLPPGVLRPAVSCSPGRGGGGKGRRQPFLAHPAAADRPSFLNASLLTCFPATLLPCFPVGSCWQRCQHCTTFSSQTEKQGHRSFRQNPFASAAGAASAAVALLLLCFSTVRSASLCCLFLFFFLLPQHAAQARRPQSLSSTTNKHRMLAQAGARKGSIRTCPVVPSLVVSVLQY